MNFSRKTGAPNPTILNAITRTYVWNDSDIVDITDIRDLELAQVHPYIEPTGTGGTAITIPPNPDAEGQIEFLGSKTWDPPSASPLGALGGQNQIYTDVTVPGVSLGDIVSGVSMSSDLSGCTLEPQVIGINTVRVYLVNPTNSAVDVASGTLRVIVQAKRS